MHSMRILLVEDDRDIQRFLQRSLAETGYNVDLASSAAAAAKLVQSVEYELLIVDLGLPDKDGIDLIHEIRGLGNTARVLILSARHSVDERVKGLENGGDDYLTKPFALAELVARLRNLCKRDGAAQSTDYRLCVMDLEVDVLNRSVVRAGVPIDLTRQEFTLLEYLCRNAGRPVTRSMILQNVWGLCIQPKTNVVDVQMSRLREKIDGGGQVALISTLRGMGYVIRNR